MCADGRIYGPNRGGSIERGDNDRLRVAKKAGQSDQGHQARSQPEGGCGTARHLR